MRDFPGGRTEEKRYKDTRVYTARARKFGPFYEKHSLDENCIELIEKLLTNRTET